MRNVRSERGSDDWPRALGLAVVDVALVLTFVVLGEIRHGVDPVANSGRVGVTALPFVVAWLVAAGLLGLYTGRFTVRETTTRVVAAWVVAALVGVGVRITPMVPGGFAVPFALVSLVVGLVLLVPWRVAVAYVETRRGG